MKEEILSLFAVGGLLFAIYSFNREKDEHPDAVITLDRPNILFGNSSTVRLDEIYQKYGNAFDLDWKLLKAIAIVESSENPNARNPADPSIGLMQILCVPDGNGGCKNNFNLPGWQSIKEEHLLDAETSVEFGSQILKWNIDTYGYKRGIAVYNSWSARNDPEEGPFSNQSYVDKVLNKRASLGV